jgi:hypothetical protein
LAEDFEGNRLFGPAGVVWGGGYAGRRKSGAFTVHRELSPFLNASYSFGALLERELGRRKLEKEDLTLAVSTVSSALSALPKTDRVLLPRIERLVKSGRVEAAVPEPDRPVSDHSGLGKVLLVAGLRKLRSLPAGKVSAHPAHIHFPGPVPRTAKRTRKKVLIDTSIPGWHGLGLYAPPGETVRLHVGESLPNKGYELRIGAHKDQLWGKKAWKRAPAVCRTSPVKSVRTEGASGFGGLVYLVVPRNSRAGSVKITLEGAVESPLFLLGETGLEEWKSKIRNRPGPWAELATSKVVITVPSKNVRKLDDPESLMKFWDEVADACADLAMRSRKRERPERYVADVQISAGYMHAGYPIMTHLDAAPRFVDLAALRAKGDWGMFHEIGHNHQDSMWTFGGAGEVTVNLFTLYILEKVCPDAPTRKNLTDGARRKTVKAYVEGGAKFSKWKSSPFLALIMYMQLREGFGWDSYKKVFARYRTLRKGERPRSDEEKRDLWMVSFSGQVRRNLGPFFEAWGVPTSKKARASVAHFRPWMPPGFPPKGK